MSDETRITCAQDGNVHVIELAPGVRRAVSFEESSAIVYENDLGERALGSWLEVVCKSLQSSNTHN